MFDFLGRPRGAASLLAASTIAIVAATSSAYAQEQERSFDIPAQPLASALLEFSRQADVMVMTDQANVSGMRAPALQGTMAPSEALTRLLAGSGLRADPRPEGGFALSDPNRPTRLGDAGGTALSDEGATSEILVVGNRSLNADIRRSEDDAQPYVVITGDEIRNSGAPTLEEFLRQRLPMNTASVGYQQQPPSGLQGRVNLRGLGANQTLILVDGRRLPGVSTSQDFSQPNVTGISPSAIERIEILPATASGIYGGGATGGVVNIILRRDYNGIDVEAGYSAAEDGAASARSFSIAGGSIFNRGRTQLMFSLTHSAQDELLATERDFGARSFAMLTRNYPNYPFLSAYAIGPTPNIISADGSNLVLDAAFGGASLGSPWTFVPAGYSGPGTSGTSSLVNNGGRLFVTDRPSALFSGPTIDSMAASVRHEVSSWLDSYIDLSWDRSETAVRTPEVASVTVAADAANNPFQQSIVAVLPVYQSGLWTEGRGEAETRRLNLGAIAELPYGWRALVDYGRAEVLTPNYSEINLGPTPAGVTTLQAAAFTDLAAVPIANIESLFRIQSQETPAENSLETWSLRLSGPLIELPGGRITLSSLLEQRTEQNDDYVSTSVTAPAAATYSWTPSASQEVSSAYLELRAPIVSAENHVPLIRELELMAAGRHDEYRTRWAAGFVPVPSPGGPFPAQDYALSEFSSSNSTFGLRYSPIEDLILRGSVSTGFLPPSLSRLKSNPATTTQATATYSAGTIDRLRNERLLGDPTTGLITQVTGGNPNLQPETSESISYGLVLTPRFLDGLRISIDFTEIEKAGEITTPNTQFLLDNAGLFPERFVRAPLTPSDIAAGQTAGRIVFFDRTAINLFNTEVQATDIQVDYDFATAAWGDWHFYAVATHQTAFVRQTSATAAPVDSVSFSGGPLEWRGNVGMEWSGGRWAFGWNAQYFDEYTLCTATLSAASCLVSDTVVAQGNSEVDAQFYSDAFLRYRFPNGDASLLSGTEVTFGVQNVFDEAPPILALDRYSSYGDPRLRRFTLTLRKHFGG